MSRTSKTSLLFAPLAVRVHTGFSAFPFYTPTKLLLRFHIRYKVRNRVKIRNRYNLTQDVNGKVTNSQLDIINESQSEHSKNQIYFLPQQPANANNRINTISDRIRQSGA